MCWLILVGVRRSHGDPEAVFDEHGYVAEPATNPMLSLLGSDAVKLTVSDGHCGCAIRARSEPHARLDAGRMRERYRRKGWSEGKIERAVQARLASDAAREDRRVSAIRFPGAISALVKGGAEVTLVAHLCDGSFDAPFAIAAREHHTLEQFTARGGAFPADTLVTVTA